MPYFFGNVSAVPAYWRPYPNLHFRIRRARSVTQVPHHPPKHNTTQNHHNLKVSSHKQKKKSPFSRWLKSFVQGLSIPLPPSESDSKLSWYTSGENSNPFIAGKCLVFFRSCCFMVLFYSKDTFCKH